MLVADVKPVRHDQVRFGEDFLTGPQVSTRVWADDINGDGKLDLLVGDNVTLTYPAKGLDAERAKTGYEEWMKEQQRLFEAELEGEEFQKQFRELMSKRDKFVSVDNTGFVWVLYQE